MTLQHLILSQILTYMSQQRSKLDADRVELECSQNVQGGIISLIHWGLDFPEPQQAQVSAVPDQPNFQKFQAMQDSRDTWIEYRGLFKAEVATGSPRPNTADVITDEVMP